MLFPLAGGSGAVIKLGELVMILDLHRQGLSVSAIARQLCVDRKTVRRAIAKGLEPPKYKTRPPRSRIIDPFEPYLKERLAAYPGLTAVRLWREAKERGYAGGYSVLRDCVRDLRPPRAQARQAAFDWMRALIQKKISLDALRREVGDFPDIAILLDRLYSGRLSDRNRSMAILGSRHGLSSDTVCSFLGIDKKTYRKYLRTFETGRQGAVFARKINTARKFDNEAVKQAVFGLLHEPPSNYGINRTTWIMRDLSRVLRETGRPACCEVIRKITKAAGYRWRKARIVLTSRDSDYTEKLGRIRSILSGLGPDEAFFSIDEFGPFAVKMKPGRALSAPGEQRVVPQWQKSRGCMIITAALELSGNQVTHFYSAKKNTAEMIRMMEVLVEQYHDRRKLYLSWDAASWHISKRLCQRVEEHNASILGGGGLMVETAPLPSGAQFLNVIESIFSGMARSIIHNSDYKTLDEAKAAIDRYFADRNAHFLHHPRRAGKKIWGKERELAEFSEANNCKDPRYR
jgi:transposase